MVAPGNVNPKGMRPPPPPGQGQPVIKAAGAATPTVASEGLPHGPPRMPGATQHNTEVLHRRSKMPFCPKRMAIGGFACAAIIGYFTLSSNKKPEATALDVAKVVAATALPENTRPRN